MAPRQAATPHDEPFGTAPFSRHEFENDVATVVLYLMRQAYLVTGDPAAGAAFVRGALPAIEDDFTEDAEGAGLAYASVAHTEFAQAFETMYDFAYFGRLRADAEAMGDESSYAQAADLVFDLQRATLPATTSQDHVVDTARRLLQIAETANARHLLEGGYEPFVPFVWRNKLEFEAEAGELTVRQLALLAGTSEMTIRTLANPKRDDGIKTVHRDGRTTIDIAAAKDWLLRKGKYVAVRRDWSRAPVDLATAKLGSTRDLVDLLDVRLAQLADETPGGAPFLKLNLEKAKLPFTATPRGLFLDITATHLSNPATLKTLAAILGLPEAQLALRAREVAARDELARVQAELDALKQSNKQ